MISQITPAGREPGQPRQIDGAFGLPRALQHAALLRLQGENMAGPRQIAGLRLRIDRHMNRRGPIRGRDARRNVFPRIDGHGEGRAERGSVLNRLLREMEFFDSLGSQGETDQPTGMFGHEIDGLGRHVLRGHDEIAFILTIFVIDEDDELPLLDVPNCLFDAVKGSGHRISIFNGYCSMDDQFII